MKLESDELSLAPQALRDRPIVTGSRDYARRWQQARAQALSVRGVVFVSGGMIAAACMAVYVAVVVWPAIRYPAVEERLETRGAETKSVALDDGSRIVLDSRSRLRVAYTPAVRDIELGGGGAHFEVAKEARRPFRVRTKLAEVVAVGTAFDVVVLAERTTVTVIEGRVNVRAMSVTAPAGAPMQALTSGEQLEVTSVGQRLFRCRRGDADDGSERCVLVVPPHAPDVETGDAAVQVKRIGAMQLIAKQ